MTHLYLDTNAYLTFFHLSSDDLEELKKLLLLVKNGEIKLHLPEQTYDEFHRNREVKIADAIKRFKEEKLANQFPQMTKEYPEFKKMKDAIKTFEENKAKLMEKLLDDVDKLNLAADNIIAELFTEAEFYNINPELLEQAKRRYNLGRPPGKNKSYGDALNWETLLVHTPQSEDLHFISDDKDYFSEIDQDKFNRYLLHEWEDAKKSKLVSYRRISQFFKIKFPDIKIASEYEKDLLVKQLANSGSFSNARTTLRKLSQFEEFSAQQLTDLLDACTTNSQVYWIKNDGDIKEMIIKIVNSNLQKIDKEVLDEYKNELGY